MDPKKFTSKVAEAINKAHSLALEQSQQQLTALHLAAVLVEDPEGIARACVLRCSSDAHYQSLARTLRRKLDKLPTVSPAPDEVYPSGDFKKALQEAGRLSKKRGDAYLGVDVLLLAVVEAKDVAAAVQESGIPKVGGGERARGVP